MNYTSDFTFFKLFILKLLLLFIYLFIYYHTTSHIDTLRVLDLSQNNIGPRPSNVTGSDYVTITNGSEDEASSIATTETKVEAVLHICDLLKRLPLTELKMNRCKLFTKGSMALFKMLSDTGQDTCGHSLKVLQLSGNEIFDSITDSLTMMLKKNTVLQVTYIYIYIYIYSIYIFLIIFYYTILFIISTNQIHK